MLKSPLRYPGGKLQILPSLFWYIPSDSNNMTLYEPFVGGGVFFLNCLNRFKRIHINDIDPRVSSFWKYLRESPAEFARAVREVTPGREFYNEIRQTEYEDTLEYAAKWYVYNRIAFNGNTTTGGYSGTTRFTERGINYLQRIGEMLQTYDITITCDDYQSVLDICGDGFVYADPPYSNVRGLYMGHSQFNHDKFREALSAVKTPWICTYDVPAADKFKGFPIIYTTLSYSNRHVSGNEAIILNAKRQVMTPEFIKRAIPR